MAHSDPSRHKFVSAHDNTNLNSHHYFCVKRSTAFTQRALEDFFVEPATIVAIGAAVDLITVQYKVACTRGTRLKSFFHCRAVLTPLMDC